ncbi:MAG: DNA repair helicase XPB [Deltaproteobacteria bacterium]
MEYKPNNPLIVQSDRTIMAEVKNDLYEEARDSISRFSEIIKSPEYIHTYRITPLSLWNAAASGMKAEDMLVSLEKYGKYALPDNIKKDILDYVGRYGKVKLLKENDELVLKADDQLLITEIEHNKKLQQYLKARIDANTIAINADMRGHIKHALLKVGYPVEDLAGYIDGTFLDVQLREISTKGSPFSLRKYQKEAVDIFYAGGSSSGGSGVIVFPCGAGKTIVGMGTMERLKCQTLILTTNITAVRQWKDELINKTCLTEDDIGEYTGEIKEIKPVTISTYQILTHRKGKNVDFPHFKLFKSMNWGLIIYDEVHLLPDPVFRVTAEIQAMRRLGLTATLVREDGLEEDVFSLIGPKKYDVPWKDLERQGWIATASCTEIRVPMEGHQRVEYAMSTSKEQFRIASENNNKYDAIEKILKMHSEDNVLIIGQYINQLEMLVDKVKAPIITGKTPNTERIHLYEQFKSGKIKRLIVSKVANFAIDLPDANVAIQVSGTFGSRQEEAQRLGRILRPKSDQSQAHFYSIVTKETKDEEYAANRQLFLTEQGYKYRIIDAEELN